MISQHIFLGNQSLADSLRSELSQQAQILTAGDGGWSDALKSFNKDSESQTPSIYVRCTSESDVSACIRYATANNIPLTARSGCHNLGNFSLLNGGFIIDVSRMKKIRHSLAEGTITYQTGCRFGEIDDYVWNNLHGYAFVGAMDPSIGTAGARCALGVGWLQRYLGNGIDNIVGARIALADGRIVDANEKQNSDLLTAIRGAGSNFGIVTELTQKIHYVLDPNQGQEVRFAAHSFDISVAQSVYSQIQNLSSRADLPDQTFILPVLHFVNGKRALSIFFCHYRYDLESKTIDQKEHWVETALRSLVQKYGAISINHIGGNDGWVSITHKTLQSQAMNIPWGSGFYPCGGFVADEQVKNVTSALIKHWETSNIPEFSKDVPFHSTSFYHFGGKVQRNRNSQTSAWPGNNKTALLTVTWGGWKNPEDKNSMIQWVKEQWKDLFKHLQFGYLCAAAYDWNSKDYSRFVYGANYQKLSLLKAKYDPLNIFRHNVNIRPNSQI